MKAFVSAWTAGLVFSMASTGAAVNEVDVTRGQAWLRVEASKSLPALRRGLGIYGSASTRYNFAFQKEVNDLKADADPEKFWLTELFLGPTFGWKTVVGTKLGLSAVYRAQLYDDYTRHTLMLTTKAFQPIGKFQLSGRSILWNFFPEGNAYDYELVHRLLLGFQYSVTPWMAFTFEEEVFLKYTAEEGDIDGSEFFNKNMIWTGPRFSIGEKFSFHPQYLWSRTIPESNELRERVVNDHYLYLLLGMNL